MKLSISSRQASCIAALQGIIVLRLVLNAYAHLSQSSAFYPVTSGILSLLHVGVSSTMSTVVGDTVAGMELLLAGAFCYGMAALVRRTPPYITRRGLLVTITGLGAMTILSAASVLAHGWVSSPEAIFSLVLIPFMLAGIILAAIERASLPTEPVLLSMLLADYR